MPLVDVTVNWLGDRRRENRELQIQPQQVNAS